jgi:hypothetical protein
VVEQDRERIIDVVWRYVAFRSSPTDRAQKVSTPGARTYRNALRKNPSR